MKPNPELHDPDQRTNSALLVAFLTVIILLVFAAWFKRVSVRFLCSALKKWRTRRDSNAGPLPSEGIGE